MSTNIDSLIESGCRTEKQHKICRSRGGESCAFDGAMIVLQPIADTAHVVHGPIACCGNSWEGRGSLSSKGSLHRMGFTTDMNEMDIIYGSEEKLYKAILKTYEAVKPKAIFVYATCVSGLIGEDIESVCKKAEAELNIRVIPVNAPGFVGPKNLGNRIAGEVLLDYVIGTGEPPENPPRPPFDKGGPSNIPPWEKGDEGGFINLIGEYNIAGDLWLVEPVLNAAGIRILSRITGDSTFEEITYAHRAKLNVVVCSRALVNVAKGMERKYGIPYVEVSFFGRTEMSRSLRLISSKIEFQIQNLKFKTKVEEIIGREEDRLDQKLRAYEHLKGKKAVLYTGGVKSWSFISALHDLGLEIVAVGTKKSTLEDEEKMKDLLGENAPLVEDVTPKNLLRLLKERNADILVAGGRNQYLAVKEGYPFVDVNQERHIAYAGFDGLLNLAEQISNSLKFYCGMRITPPLKLRGGRGSYEFLNQKSEILINPLKHSQSIGAAMAFQGVHNAIPVIHGAQGCTFLSKVLLTKHFREPIALASSKLFTEDVVMGSDDNLGRVVEDLIVRNRPDVIGILSSGLTEVKGDDVEAVVKNSNRQLPVTEIIHLSTPDYEGGLETGYARAVEGLLRMAENPQDYCMPYTLPFDTVWKESEKQVNILAGSLLTPADFTELREIVESFGLTPVILPDLSALDGSRRGISALAAGGTQVCDIKAMGASEFTIAVGASMGKPARLLKEAFNIDYVVFESIAGLKDVDMFMETLSRLSGRDIPLKYRRQSRILTDGLRDLHFHLSNKKICIALDPDLCLQISRCLFETGARVESAVIPYNSAAAGMIQADNVRIGGLFSIEGDFDLLIANSHAEDAAKRLGIPLCQMGFPVYKVLGNANKITIGYRGTLSIINNIANLLLKE